MTRQEEIKTLLRSLGIKQTFIADKLGISRQVLSYQLNEANDLDFEYYFKIKELLRTSEPDRVADNLTPYFPIDDAMKSSFKDIPTYKILGKIPAGRAELFEYNDWQENDDLFYDPRNHFWLVIDSEYGYSMTPFLQPGDMVLCSVSSKYKDGDIVAVRWDKTKGAIKILSHNPEVKDTIGLFSYNNAEKPIILSRDRIEQIYKVVNIKKK